MNDYVQERMKAEFLGNEVNPLVKEKEYLFKHKLKRAVEEGLLITVKYGLALVLAFYALNALTSIISGATNGTQAALYLNELQNKGYLPKVINGQVPDKETQNATPNTIK